MKRRAQGTMNVGMLFTALSIILVIGCGTPGRTVSTDGAVEKQGSGDFIAFDDKTYVVNYAGELMDVSDCLITREAGQHLFGETFKATVSITRFDPSMIGMASESSDTLNGGKTQGVGSGQDVSGECIENGTERLKQKEFAYCISRFNSGYTVTYTGEYSSITYSEKTDDLESFKRNSDLSILARRFLGE